MPRAKYELGVFEDAKAHVGISFHKSYLTGKEYGKIDRRTVTIRNLIASITENRHVGISKVMLDLAAELLKDEMLEYLGRGFAINMFDLGVLYITVRGEISRDMKPTELAEHIQLAFTPSKMAEAKVQDFIVQKINVKPSSRYIESVIDLTNDESAYLTAGMYTGVRGAGLKLGEENSGVYLAPVIDGVMQSSEQWIKIKRISRNEPKNVEFLFPKCVGLFKIVIETNLSVSGKPMKSIVRIISDVVEVRAESEEEGEEEGEKEV